MEAQVPNRGPELLAIDIAFAILALTACVLRVFTRTFMVKAFGVDDILMVISTAFFLVYASFSMAGTHFGTGHHHKDLQVSNIQAAMKCWWMCYLTYTCSMITSKISIGLFLLRIAAKKIHQHIIYGAMTISVISGMAFFFVTLFQCNPSPYFWNRYVPGEPGSCVPSDVIIGLGFLYTSFSLISDFTFALLPAVLIWDLKLKQRTKFAIIPLLAMGCVASCAVVARYPYMPRLREVDDFLWATVDIAIWSTVEQGLAITAGSLATLRPLFKHIGYGLGLTTRPSDYGPGGGTNAGGYAKQTHQSATHGRSRKLSRSGVDDFSSRSNFSQLDDEARVGSSGGQSIPLSKVEVRITAGRAQHSSSTSSGSPHGGGLRPMSEKNESEEELTGTGNQKVVQPISFVSDDEHR
ncbi:Satratoxin biosynthesis SC1 cluster protein 4 [Apiospora rasikravindrae]|uniref:Satratoxin biosynthesis SC1 cluster protein 4 n=1 Tax=Apiospora rasikravindrae TaxID=990691 RepID=A0ABR1SZN5_9PEZI